MTTPEGRLLAACKKRLDALHRFDPTFVWRKRHGSLFSKTGDPDITGLWAGKHFEIELKVPGKSPTTLQWFRLREWHDAGAFTFVVHNLEELNEALSQIIF